MSRQVVNELLAQLDAAFDGPDWHSLLRNLSVVAEDDWLWVPPGGRRSIRDIVQHVGGVKYVYQCNAFGDGSLDWGDPLPAGEGRLDTIPDAVQWLREGHARLRDALVAVEDEDLGSLRKHHSRGKAPLSWIIAVLLQHDLYHSGEINHIRALKQGDDE